jgi:alcohol dehydrogenase class IV
MEFEFATATRIIFGPGSSEKLGALTAESGVRALLVSGVPEDLTRSVLDRLSEKGVEPTLFTVSGEPTIDLIETGARTALKAGCQVIIGFGGGSAVDTGKDIAAMLTNPGNLLDYLEVIGQNKPLLKPSAPFIAVPTSAGTGSEVTRNAVLYSPEHQIKVSLRSPFMLARIALVDPLLTYSMPPAVTASTGLDALTQVIEPFVSNAANPLTDSLCRDGIRRASRSLLKAYEVMSDAAAREDMSLASLFGGLALANAKLGAVHGFAAVLGGMFHAPHGAICAALLPHVMAINVRAMQERLPHSPSLPRYGEVSCLMTGKENASAADGIALVEGLTKALHIPPLSTYGVTKNDFHVIIEKSAAASSMKGNPVKLTSQELEEVLTLAF